MSHAKPLARDVPGPTRGAVRRTFANSPNRRREVLRVAAWALVTGGAAVMVPFLIL